MYEELNQFKVLLLDTEKFEKGTHDMGEKDKGTLYIFDDRFLFEGKKERLVVGYREIKEIDIVGDKRRKTFRNNLMILVILVVASIPVQILKGTQMITIGFILLFFPLGIWVLNRLLRYQILKLVFKEDRLLISVYFWVGPLHFFDYIGYRYRWYFANRIRTQQLYEILYQRCLEKGNLGK